MTIQERWLTDGTDEYLDRVGLKPRDLGGATEVRRAVADAQAAAWQGFVERRGLLVTRFGGVPKGEFPVRASTPFPVPLAFITAFAALGGLTLALVDDVGVGVTWAVTVTFSLISLLIAHLVRENRLHAWANDEYFMHPLVLKAILVFAVALTVESFILFLALLVT